MYYLQCFSTYLKDKGQSYIYFLLKMSHLNRKSSCQSLTNNKLYNQGCKGYIIQQKKIYRQDKNYHMQNCLEDSLLSRCNIRQIYLQNMSDILNCIARKSGKQLCNSHRNRGLYKQFPKDHMEIRILYIGLLITQNSTHILWHKVCSRLDLYKILEDILHSGLNYLGLDR